MYGAAAGLTVLSLAACGSNNEVTPTVAPTATPIPTATPVPTPATAAEPQQPGALTISDAQATELAEQALASNTQALPIQVSKPSVTFTPDAVTLSAEVQDSGTQLEVAGVPEVQDGQVRFRLTSLKLGGFEVPFYRNEVEDTINNLFEQMLAGQRVQSVQLGNGTLTVTPA
jgi:hypothetical protein